MLTLADTRDAPARLTYKKEASGKYSSADDYMHLQPEITHHERRVLCEWLADIADATGGRISLHDSYQLAVNIIDRFCIEVKIPLNLYQLLGITALFIASKCCDANPFNAQFFAALTDGDFDLEEVKLMEREILGTLKWNCNTPLPCLFVAQYSSRLTCLSASERETVWDLSNCFIEKLLYDYTLSRYRFPVLGAAAFLVATICAEIPESVALDALAQDFELAALEIPMADVHKCTLESFHYLTTRAPFRLTENISLPDEDSVEFRLTNNLVQANSLVRSDSRDRVVEKRRCSSSSSLSRSPSSELNVRIIKRPRTIKRKKRKELFETGMLSPCEESELENASAMKQDCRSELVSSSYTPSFNSDISVNRSLKFDSPVARVRDSECRSISSLMFDLDINTSSNEQVVPEKLDHEEDSDSLTAVDVEDNCDAEFELATGQRKVRKFFSLFF